MRATKPLFIGAIFSALMLWQGAPAEAQAQTKCLKTSTVLEIKKEIRIELNDPSGGLCQRDSKTYKLFETLIFLKNLRFSKSTKIDAKINQGLLAKGFWPYLREQKLQAIVESNHSLCQKSNIYGFVDQASNPNVISLCPYFFNKTVSTPDRAQLILHESRHFSGHAHVNCQTGPWRGIEGGCDDSIRSKGSYAVSTEAMARVGVLGKNLSKAARTNAKLLSLGYAQNRFNTPVYANGARAVYLSSGDQAKAYIYNGKSFYAAPLVTDATIISRQSDLHVFPKDRDEDAYVLNTYSRSEKVDEQAGKNALTLQYNRLDRATRPELLDVVTVGEFLCFVQPLVIDCSNSNGKKLSITPTTVLTKVFSPAEMAMRAPKNSLLLVNGSDLIQRLVLKSDGTYEVFETEGFKAIVQFPGGRLALRADGSLVKEKGSSWVAVPNTRGVKFDTLSRSFFWSPNFIEASHPGQ